MIYSVNVLYNQDVDITTLKKELKKIDFLTEDFLLEIGVIAGKIEESLIPDLLKIPGISKVEKNQLVSSIVYLTDKENNWWRKELNLKCTHALLFGMNCQGTKNHAGEHWCYDESGNYVWENERESGLTPPDHMHYKHPAEMRKHYYLNFNNVSKVTDSNVIAKLENEEAPEFAACINKPFLNLNILKELQDRLSNEKKEK